MRSLAARAGQYLLVLWAAATLNFLLPHLAPGDPIVYLYGDGENLTDEQLADIRASYGLDQSLLEQYGEFLVGVFSGDLGFSVTRNQPVLDVLLERLPWTLALVGVGTVLAFGLGTLLGAAAAWRRGTRRDASTVFGVLALDAMPAFWVGMVLVAIFSVQLGWFPSFGAVTILADGAQWWAEVAQRMVLPVATVVLAGLGSVFLLARASMTSVLDEAFIRLARSKGIPERRLAVRHALRTALLPVFTHLTLAVSSLVSVAVVVETVFAYPGIGQLIYQAVTARDYPLLQGAFLLITVGIVAANLLADLTYPLLDPRVRRTERVAEVAP